MEVPTSCILFPNSEKGHINNKHSIKKILTNIDSFYGSQRENEEHREHYILSINEKGLCYYLLLTAFQQPRIQEHRPVYKKMIESKQQSTGNSLAISFLT